MKSDFRFTAIDAMPDMPQAAPPDWKRIAERFKAYVLNPDNRVMFVNGGGHAHFAAFHDGTGEELITLGGVVLGGIFQGEDVGPYLPSIADFYHEEHRIFLNAPRVHLVEYWYLMFVNALAASIIRLRADEAPELVPLLRTGMESLITLAHKIGYDFNDQGFDFRADAPFTNKDIFRQPDSIGGYAYLMVFAYDMFGGEHFLEEARTAMDRYLAFADNPWYEMPNGAMACLAAARLNELGGRYDIRKAVSFVFDPHQGPLHVGKWGDTEVNGLMRGWRGNLDESERKIAYSLETLILLPYLLPVLKTEPGLAAAVGKYALNAASNAGWFIPDRMPEESQSTPQFTPDVPYENLVDAFGGKSPYASGDFHGHRSVYGGAVSLWWDAVLRQTDDPYMLQWDLDRTDFLGRSESGASYTLVYNPYPQPRETVIEPRADGHGSGDGAGDAGSGLAEDRAAGCGRTFEAVDLVTNMTVFTGGTGRMSVTVPAKQAVVLKVSVAAE